LSSFSFLCFFLKNPFIAILLFMKMLIFFVGTKIYCVKQYITYFTLIHSHQTNNKVVQLLNVSLVKEAFGILLSRNVIL